MTRFAFPTGGGSRRWQLVLFVGAAVLAAACDGRQEGGGPGGSSGAGTGAIAFALTVPNGVELDTVSYQLTNAAGTTVQSGSVSVQSSQSIEFQLGNVWPGNGYTVTTTSTGSGERYCCNTPRVNPTRHVCELATTPSGRFTFKEFRNGWDKSPLGQLYNPFYFNGGIAVHGYQSVPASPASHGCVACSGQVTNGVAMSSSRHCGVSAASLRHRRARRSIRLPL